MGVDAKMFIEYWHGPHDAPVWGEIIDASAVIANDYNIHSITDGCFNIERNRNVFRALAGVRTADPPLYAPRGLPPIVSQYVGRQSLVRIIKDEEHGRGNFRGCRRSVAVDLAERGLARYGGYSSKLPYEWITDGIIDGGWLYLREVDDSLAFRGLSVETCEPCFAAMIAAMRTLESRFGTDRTRLVFWFDGV